MFSNEKRYSRTDLACEIITSDAAEADAELTEYERDGFRVSITQIKSEAASRRLGKPCGIYHTLFTGKTRTLPDEKRKALIALIAEILKDCVCSATNKHDIPSATILVAGIGNRNLTADAVGPLVVEKLTVTRELKFSNRDLFTRLECADVSAIAPGVAAETGIEAADIIRAAAEAVDADAIILVDALAARSCHRLAATVQITDTGVSPGSGIGNTRTPIDSETMHVPVVTVGIPTVVDSSTLVYEALTEGDVDPDSLGGKLDEILSSGRSFFVSPQDTDVIVEDMSAIVAEAIDTFCGTR